MKRIVALLILAICLLACGKKSMPTPVFEGDRIAWRNVTVNLLDNNCLAINAEIKGKAEDVSSIILELEPVTDNICTTCPFQSYESVSVNTTKAKVNDEALIVNFSYCPSTPANAYRYRLGAKNSNPVYPIVLTLPKLVEKENTSFGVPD